MKRTLFRGSHWITGLMPQMDDIWILCCCLLLESALRHPQHLLHEVFCAYIAWDGGRYALEQLNSDQEQLSDVLNSLAAVLWRKEFAPESEALDYCEQCWTESCWD